MTVTRVPYMTRDNLPESQRHIYDEMAKSRGVTKIGRNFEALMNSPEATARVMAVGTYLRFQSELPAATRELVTITVANEMDCEFEWIAHEKLAQKAGVSDSSIAAIRNRTAPDGLPPEEAILVRYVLELMRHHRMTDDIYNAVLAQLGTKSLIDLTLLTGYYSMLALAFLALDIQWE